MTPRAVPTPLAITFPLGVALAQHGWAVHADSNSLDMPFTTLMAESTNSSATFELALIESQLARSDTSWIEYLSSLGSRIVNRLGCLHFGADRVVLVRACFLPGTTRVARSWQSLAPSGHRSVILAPDVRDDPDYHVREFGRDEGARMQRLVDRFRGADTLRVKPSLYARRSILAFITVQNDQSLDQIVTRNGGAMSQEPR